MIKYDTNSDLSAGGFNRKINNLSSARAGSGDEISRDLGVMYLDHVNNMESAHSSREALEHGFQENLSMPGSTDTHTPEPDRIIVSTRKGKETNKIRTGFDNLVSVFGAEKKTKKKTKRNDMSPRLPHDGALLSIIYGILLVILGIAFPVKEALQGVWLQNYVAAVFLVYMYGVGFIFLVAIEIYLVCLSRRYRKSSTSCPESPRSPGLDPGFINSGFEPDDRSRNSSQLYKPRSLAMRYSSRSSGAFSESTVYEDGDVVTGSVENKRETTLYIRIVLIVLGLAAVVYDGLLVKQLHEGLAPSSCGHVSIFWPRYLHIGFLLAQCYFLFKHSQVKILRNRTIFRLGFIHVLVTNCNEMIRAFITHTFNGYVYKYKNNTTSDTHNSTVLPLCEYETDIHQQAAPYLYPCVVEFNFLAMALVYFMFCSLDDGNVYFSPNPNDTKNHTEINCQRTHKGLFFGIVVLAGTTVSMILFFAYTNLQRESGMSLFIFQVSDIVLHGIIFIGVMVVWVQTRKLSYLPQLELAFEDGVLLTAMAVGLLFTVFHIMPIITILIEGSTEIEHILSLTGSLLAMVTIIFQATFIIDLSCRYLTLDTEWDIKPGRGCVMFLLLANLAVWLLKTFQIRALDLETGSLQELTYGYISWQIITNGCVPFIIYYYLFSSACLARTWHQIYTTSAAVRFDAEYSPRHEKYSTPAKEFEFVRQRKVNRALRLDIDNIVSPVSDV